MVRILALVGLGASLLLVLPAAAYEDGGSQPAKTYSARSLRLGEGDLHTRYADALQYFEPKLKAEDAGRVAETVIAQSRKVGVDARLVIALLAAEETLRPVASGKLSVEKANDSVSNATRELAIGIEVVQRSGVPTLESISAALESRARHSARSADRRHPAQYARRVLKLYAQLTGMKT